MKKDITQVLVTEHRLILRMIDLLERNASEMLEGNFSDWRFFIDAIDFIRNYADRFHHAKEEDVLFEALVANGMPREHSPVAAMLMEHDAGRAHVALLDKGVKAAMAGETGQEPVIAEHAFGYATLLRRAYKQGRWCSLPACRASDPGISARRNNFRVL